MEDSEAAIETFNEVASMKVPYELSFKRTFNKQHTTGKASSEAIVDMLEKMLTTKRTKNI